MMSGSGKSGAKPADSKALRIGWTARSDAEAVTNIAKQVIEQKLGYKVEQVSVPCKIACGRCRACKEQRTGVCLSVNPARAGGAYGWLTL
jgi:hypothetical protein